MGWSWANFFLQLHREVYSWTGIVSWGTVLFGHILFRVLWKGKLCRFAGFEEELFPGGPAWINSSERGSVFLSSITYPCLLSKEQWGSESLRGDSPSRLTLVRRSIFAAQQCPVGRCCWLAQHFMDRSGEVQLWIIHGPMTNFIFLLLVLTFWITSVSVSKGKIQGSEHSEHFLVIQCVCHVSKFMLGEIQTSGRKWGFQMSFCPCWGCAL